MKLSKIESSAFAKGCYKIFFLNGDDRARTGDLRLAKPPLSQLSYIPINMGLGGFEPPTSRLSGARSNHLSYKPKIWLSARRTGGQNLSKNNTCRD